MKLKSNWKLWAEIGTIIVLICMNIVLSLALKQSHANERSLSQRIDVLMLKEKASRP